MHHGQLQSRCPSAQFLRAVKLPDHELAFTRFSPVRRCGVADIVSHEKGIVFGGLFRIVDPDDWERLDRSEFCHRKGYQRRKAKIQEQTGAASLDAWTYEVVAKATTEYTPSRDYLSAMIEGAQMCDLPQDYIAWLESLSCQES